MAIIDVDHRFDVTRLVAPSSIQVAEHLPAGIEDLKHIYIYRPARSSLRTSTGDEDEPAQSQNQIQVSVTAAQQHMLYGAHASRNRVWWGTVVIGGGGGDVNAGWKGWLDVQRTEVAPFGVGMSAEEALMERDRRHEMITERGWEARSRVGVYSWGGAAG